MTIRVDLSDREIEVLRRALMNYAVGQDHTGQRSLAERAVARDLDLKFLRSKRVTV